MAFVRLDGDAVKEVKEKESFTNDPQSEHASTGLYYFRSGALMKHAFKRALCEDATYQGEYYVTLAFNLMVAEGLKIGIYDTDVAILGTPEEVRNFEAWQQIINSGHIKNEFELLQCYHYWRAFNRQ
jgi:bifunctional N-acetylglucosamine-1-phosphate-uridyltransferase/glucosamine-1-phosphate-acetyltransferase GlmU-like protein